MTQPMNEPTPQGGYTNPSRAPEPQKKGGLSGGVIALIVGLIAVILALVIFIVVKSGGGDATDGASAGSTSPEVAETTGEAGATDSATDGATDAQAQDPSADATPLDPRVKEAIEGQWRLEEGDPMALGDVDADLVFQIYSDYQCGYCHKFNIEAFPQIKQLTEDGTLRIEYHELPVLGPKSQLAAQASHAAAEQDKFWEFHDAIYADWGQQAPDFTEDYLVGVAEEVGVADIEKFKTDMTGEEITQKVADELAYSTQVLGITGTPSFIIGYSYIPGNIPFEQMQIAIDQELERAEAGAADTTDSADTGE